MMLKRNSEILIQNLEVADKFWPRLMGLMGRADLATDQAVLFPSCNAIHTCFMKFSIDCVFLNSEGRVTKIYHELKPWKWAGPVWGAESVIELKGGFAKQNKIQEGDQLLCGH